MVSPFLHPSNLLPVRQLMKSIWNPKTTRVWETHLTAPWPYRSQQGNGKDGSNVKQHKVSAWPHFIFQSLPSHSISITVSCIVIFIVITTIWWWFIHKSCPTCMTPWTVACQAPLSMGSPGKNTGVGFHFLLQGIFPTQESNPGLLYCRWIL